MRKGLILVMVLLMAFSMSAQLFAGGQQEAADDEITMLFMPGVADPFYYVMEKGIVAKGEELGVNIIVAEFPKAWGPEVQVPILEATVAQGGIDMILIAPTAIDALISPLKKLYDQGIEIITVDTYLGDGDYSKDSDYSFPLSYIGSDNEKGGREMAAHLCEMIGGEGKVYINSTNPDVSSVMGRVKGFKEGIEAFPEVELVGVDYNMDVQQKATDQTLAALQKDPDIAGIFGTNLYSSQGAYQAVVNAGLVGAVKIATWDASVDIINALKKGQIDLVLAQKPFEIGSLAVEWGYKFFTEGTEIPAKVIPGFEFFDSENVNDPDMEQFIYK
ncbi:MAG: ABC transporter substrate-binding protein [Spirochaetales bacterium]|uniref:ABC transporter substrate-binding protein n=1 Tax=Candidatus Thalassospirochaeta sargassi TaxID=3119039 RepID=A0AAJ1IHU9_9SPIO|nr:ABC transporter substrate-binding protein [Spirochaetales bacterium]